MLTVPPTTKLWFAAAVDLRLGFDGLANLIRTQLSADPASGHLFVFTNRSADRVKVLYWGGHRRHAGGVRTRAKCAGMRSASSMRTRRLSDELSETIGHWVSARG